MKVYDLIFSNKKKLSIQRHVIFWICIYIYHVIRISFLFPEDQLLADPIPILLGSLRWGVITNLIFSYTIIYFLIPKFFSRKKYLAFSVGVLILFMILFCFSLFSHLIDSKFTYAIGTTTQQPYIFLRGTVIRILGNPPLICALLLSLKTLKNWHLKQLENETLIREKGNAELQLLKSQIHPHFLFNTLNNIYSYTLTKSPLAAELVQKLSDMLSYMITDCNQVLVPLEKEIQLLKDYICLEKVRYGNRLDIQMHINGNCENCMVVPLLMIPFVENCFKHGASMMRGEQWMHLIIDINENDLDLNLSNSKPPRSKQSVNKKGIGLNNVQKRLSLLYPGRHQLKINSTENTFSVYLKLALEKEKNINTEKASKNIRRQAVLKPIIHY